MTVKLTLNTNNNFYNSRQREGTGKRNTSFKGIGDCVTNALIASDKAPMIGVSIIDLTSMIFPRTIVDATRNGFAATETFLRESAGLIINCLIPSFVVLGMAKLLQPFIMGKDFSKYNPFKFWANQNSNNLLTSAWLGTNSKGNADDRMKAFVSSVLDNIEGLAGKNDWRKISELSNKEEIYNSIKTAILNNDEKAVKQAADTLIETLGASRNIRLVKGHTLIPMEGIKEIVLNNDNKLKDLIVEMKDLGHTFSKMSDTSVKNFSKKLTTLVKAKSFAGLAVIVAMGASFQYFNRMLTKYRTGSSEFVGEVDYLQQLKRKKRQERINSPEYQRKLNFHKFLGVLGMGALAILSFGKVPTAKMFQFNGIFPTMNQCRAISAVTYSGRIISSANDNELKETAFRDTCTFINLYYLGDYVSKLFATCKEKFGGMKGQLLNETCALPQNANAFQKFWHWFRHTELKGFEEIAKNNKLAKNNRAYAQAAGLLYSCIVLGLIVPLYNKHRTNKIGKLKAQKQVEQNEKQINIKELDEKKIFTAFCK
ncbi:MAG: hypothetical protein MJ180_05670 [Candidatus Gastranaerophilales bacterium]|nr:hypothetical protein [Candidatus Gastranaerophilales bacterium]